MAKAQSAMEYLATYGWAILIIAVVSALLYLYSSTPSTIVPTKCVFVSGVYCKAMVLGTNTVTHATTIALFLTNSQPYPLANPYLFAQLNGANTTGVACTPKYVSQSGSIVCVLGLPSKTSLGQFLSGKLYLNATYCGLQANYSQANMCSGAPRETYAGSFNSHIEPLIDTNTVITLTVANATQPANGALDLLTATVKLLGYPLSGASVNFTANVPGYTISPNLTTTNTTGIALSHISGTTSGSVLVTASYAGLVSNVVVQFVPTVNVKFNVNFPYCASAGQIITIDGIAYTCSQITSTTFPWLPNSPHQCDLTNPVVVNSLIRAQCTISTGSGSVCEAATNTTFTINCTTQYLLTMTAGTGGSVLPATNWYNTNTVVPISQSANSGFLFTGWTGTGTVSYTGASSSASVTMNSPVSETSAYTTNVVFTESGLPGGTSWAVTFNGVTLPSTGTTIMFNNLAPASYSWTTNTGIACGTGCQYAPSTSSGSVSTVSGSASQPVSYTTQYFLTMAAGSNGAVSPSSGWYNTGSTPTITGTPNSGYSFVSWSGTGAGSYTGATNPTTITVNSATSETGSFAFVTTSNPLCGNYAGDVVYSSGSTLTCNVIAGNSITINNGITVNVHGFYMEANNTFTNKGTITDSYDLGSGGGGGGGGGLAGPTGGGTSNGNTGTNGIAGGAGKSRTSKYLSQTLTGGHGGSGGGGGGSGAFSCATTFYGYVETGPGGGGGSGGNGGGIIEIYAGNFLNQGTLNAAATSGGTGGTGAGASYGNPLNSCAAAGSGGGGAGTGGNGGMILIGYASSITLGTALVSAGSNGAAGTGGTGAGQSGSDCSVSWTSGGSGGTVSGGGGGGGTISRCGSLGTAKGGYGGNGACGGSPAGNGCTGSPSPTAGSVLTLAWSH